METGSLRAGQLLLFSGQQHSRNKYIYSYTPNRGEQKNLTGKQFQTDTFRALSVPPLSLQTQQLLCTHETQGGQAARQKPPVQSWSLFSLVFVLL